MPHLVWEAFVVELNEYSYPENGVSFLRFR